MATRAPSFPDPCSGELLEVADVLGDEDAVLGERLVQDGVVIRLEKAAFSDPDCVHAVGP
jgi:hypothetical protein